VTVCRRLSKISGEYKFQIRVIVTNTNEEIIDWLKKTIGMGFTRKSTWENYSAKWKPIHRYEVDSHKARELLAEIIPYLIIKKELAKMVLEFPTRNGGLERTIEEYEKQLNEFSKISSLNQRGVIGPAFIE